MTSLNVKPEREIQTWVDLATPEGRLAAEAVGWSRRPLHRTDLGAGWGCRKRWEYWAVLGEEAMFAVTLADLDYAGLAAVSLLEYDTWTITERALLTPLAAGLSMPQQFADPKAAVNFDALGLHVELCSHATHTQLRAEFGRGGGHLIADLRVERPPTQQSLSVVIPWSATRYQYTSKHVGLPASGTVLVGGRRYEFTPDQGARAVIDHGRGRWPRRTSWIWACAAEAPAHRTEAVGFNLGGRWTQGTGLTENGLFIGGRIEKLAEELTFEFDRQDWRRPWRIRAPSERVDLVFSPLHCRRIGALPEWLPLGARLDWRLGRYSGSLITEAGERIQVRDLLGWAEELAARW